MKTQLQEHGMYIPAKSFDLPRNAVDASRTTPHAVGADDPDIISTRRYDKRERAADTPRALGWIKRIHADAIEYSEVRPGLHGLAFAIGIVVAIALVLGGLAMAGLMVTFASEHMTSLPATLAGIGAVGVTLLAAFVIFISSIEIDLFKPEDLPLIFDRRHRRIYRLLLEEGSGLFAMFKRRLVACEYAWDLVDAEHRVYRDDENPVHGASHGLSFLVRKSHADATVIDSFQVARASLAQDQVAPLWEHIRRFMEEGGPQLPDSSEPLAPVEGPPSWSASLRAVGLFAPYFLAHWRRSPVWSLFSLLLFPLTMPFTLLWGTGHYLSWKTALRARWPDIIQERIGSAVTPAGMSETHHQGGAA